MNKLKCQDCPYYWRDDYEAHTGCHYRWNDGYAPCEVEDEPEEEYEYDEERW